MGIHSETDEDQFFDTRDEFNSGFDSGSDCTEDCSTSEVVNHISIGFANDFWVGDLESVRERRDRFMRWMGLNFYLNLDDGEEQLGDDDSCDEIERGMDRIAENTEPMLANSNLQDDGFLYRQSSFSFQSDKVRDQTGYLDEFGQDMLMKRSFEIGENRLETSEEFQRNFSSSSSVTQSSPQREFEQGDNLLDRRKKMKKGWLQKLNVILNKKDETISKPNDIHLKAGASAGAHPIRVHSNKKQPKELASLYSVQELPAHKGSILTIKFSHDGRYLASAGDDGVVRVWKVIEAERPSKLEIQGTDPSSFFFSTNHLSELAPFNADKERTRNRACVILPPKLFRILEKPVHEFHGHSGEILSLSWSKKGYLLSSSGDKTVRLWQLGREQCLKVFHHTNYVTCVEFNPVDDNYFISGSIDGKVRIWEVAGCQVIDWTDIKEIITAVCYHPNGKECIVGSIDGNCSFYDVIDNRLELGVQLCLMGKKKLPGKRIIGFQFCPIDSRKVIVSSADSQVRVLCGINIVGKFKGNRSSGNQMSASFTSDGKHIVSAAEDSNVYVWNHISSDKLASKPKTEFSCENFLSKNASIAIPWCGVKSIAAALPSPRLLLGGQNDLKRSTIDSPRMPSPLSRVPFLESLRKGSPTWPAETLPPDSTQVSVSPSMRKSEYRFLKSAYQSTFIAPHMWGLVIVTAGWDGRIRTYLNYGLPIRT